MFVRTLGSHGSCVDADMSYLFGQDLADAVDRAEWMEQSKNKKPAAKKMPKPKAMPESLRWGEIMIISKRLGKNRYTV